MSDEKNVEFRKLTILRYIWSSECIVRILESVDYSPDTFDINAKDKIK